MDMIVEICVVDSQSALAAEQGGADRVELCADMTVGGTTPSGGTTTVVCRELRIPVHVLIRPRAGDFILDRLDLEIMLEDIALARRAGARGVVLGALRPDRSVDHVFMERLITASRPMSVTFHRAFDATRDPFEALESLIELGIDRVLTSGGAGQALNGAAELARLVEAARGRISILAGGGVNAGNAAEILITTGVREIHAGSSVCESHLAESAPPRPGILSSTFAWELPYPRTDSRQVAKLVRAARLGGKATHSP